MKAAELRLLKISWRPAFYFLPCVHPTQVELKTIKSILVLKKVLIKKQQTHSWVENLYLQMCHVKF